MIAELAVEIAGQMGISLSKVVLVDGYNLGCKDTYLLHLFSRGIRVSSLIWQNDIRMLENGVCSDRLEVRIRSTLTRLRIDCLRESCLEC